MERNSLVIHFKLEDDKQRDRISQLVTFLG